MQRNIIVTADGSPSISIDEMGVSYHSKHGAIAESMHVYINTGLLPLIGKFETINIFEMGFGTGLNAYLTLLEANKSQQKICYETVELFPLKMEEIISLNNNINDDRFLQLHRFNWAEEYGLNDFFILKKYLGSLEKHVTKQQFHLIYFDAFSPAQQPELWTTEIFEKMYSMLLPNGVLVTYSSQSQARRNMEAAGFAVKKFDGIFGKRDCVIAAKL